MNKKLDSAVRLSPVAPCASGRGLGLGSGVLHGRLGVGASRAVASRCRALPRSAGPVPRRCWRSVSCRWWFRRSSATAGSSSSRQSRPAFRKSGLRSEPNLELLQSFAPDMIIIDPSITAAVPRLKLIAPVEVFTIFKPGRHPLETARSSTMELAQRLGVQAACDAYLARFDTVMTGYREQLRDRRKQAALSRQRDRAQPCARVRSEQPLSGRARPVRIEECLDRAERSVGTHQRRASKCSRRFRTRAWF